MLSGTKGLKINSIEKFLGEKFVEGINLEATLAKRLDSTFNAHGTKIISKNLK